MRSAEKGIARHRLMIVLTEPLLMILVGVQVLIAWQWVVKVTCSDCISLRDSDYSEENNPLIDFNSSQALNTSLTDVALINIVI